MKINLLVQVFIPVHINFNLEQYIKATLHVLHCQGVIIFLYDTHVEYMSE